MFDFVKSCAKWRKQISPTLLSDLGATSLKLTGKAPDIAQVGALAQHPLPKGFKEILTQNKQKVPILVSNFDLTSVYPYFP